MQRPWTVGCWTAVLDGESTGNTKAVRTERKGKLGSHGPLLRPTPQAVPAPPRAHPTPTMFPKNVDIVVSCIPRAHKGSPPSFPQPDRGRSSGCAEIGKPKPRERPHISRVFTGERAWWPTAGALQPEASVPLCSGVPSGNRSQGHPAGLHSSTADLLTDCGQLI